MTLAKSLGGGVMPIGAMLARRDLYQKAYGSASTFALHSSTFGGGSLACAAALATLDMLVAENLPAQATARGHELLTGLQSLCSRYPVIREVRGQGLLLGVEFQPMSEHMFQHFRATDGLGSMAWFASNFDDTVRAYHAFYAMQSLLQTHAIFTQTTRSNGAVLRVQPPLTITRTQVQRFLQALDSVCYEMTAFKEIVEAVLTKTIGEIENVRSSAPAAEGMKDARMKDEAGSGSSFILHPSSLMGGISPS